MAHYVDGYLLAVPKKNLPTYKKMAKDAAKVWRRHGALDYKECVGEDLRPKGFHSLFPKMANLKSSEVLIFAFIVFKSKKDRDRVNKEVMADPFLKKYENKPMPFDMKKMAYGGFDVMVGD